MDQQGIFGHGLNLKVTEYYFIWMFGVVAVKLVLARFIIRKCASLVIEEHLVQQKVRELCP